MTLLDATTLKLVSELSSKPILVPTQRGISVREVKLLRDVGCSRLLVTTTSYRETLESCKDQMTGFKREISTLAPQITP